MKKILILMILPVLLLSACINKGPVIDEEKANKFYEQGIEQLRENNYEEAVSLFAKAIEANPEHAHAYNRRGATKSEFLKQYKDALADLDRAIELNPKFAVAYNNRGICKINIRDFKGAKEDFNQAIKINPTFHLAYNSRGVIHGMLGNYADAVKDFDNVLTLEPDYVNAYMNKVLAGIKMRDYEGAQAAYDKAKGLLDEEKDKEKLEQLNKLVANVEQIKK